MKLTFPHFHICNGLPAQPLAAGFTLVEMLVVLVIIGIMGTVAVGLYDNSDDDAREATWEIMQDIKTAILGNNTASQVIGTTISGYVQDVGDLPRLNGNGQPERLWQRGGFPPRKYDDHARIWSGWNGPYLEPPDSGHLIDGWGNGLLFERRGKSLVITSAGADSIIGGSGTGEDLVMTIQESDYMAPVGGRLSPRAYNASLYYPANGVLKTMTIASAGNNQFMSRTQEVPIGLRSIIATIDGEERCFVFVVRPTVNWLGTLR
jgi:prepilin-type N-terminal cleavage/methylation domain-containing protein